MKKKTYMAWQHILLRFLMVFAVELMAFAAGLGMGVLTGKKGLLWCTCFFLLVQLVCLVILYLKQEKDRKEYQRFCRRFTQGEIYQEFIDHMQEWDTDLGGAVRRLDELIERKNVIQMSTRQAEFLALQNQINPHFLYNTLEAIRGDALCMGAETIADITEALSIFFRYTITNTRNLVTLQDELDNVETYFMIQKYRFEDKLDLKITFHDDEQTLLQMPCPKLSLQPIVENALYHGIEKVRDGGLVEIELEIVDNTVHVSISENGKGMDALQLAALNEKLQRASVGYVMDNNPNQKGGIALRNVCRRIKLLFGEEYGLQVSSIVGIGTRVEMILPMQAVKDTV